VRLDGSFQQVNAAQAQWLAEQAGAYVINGPIPNDVEKKSKKPTLIVQGEGAGSRPGDRDIRKLSEANFLSAVAEKAPGSLIPLPKPEADAKNGALSFIEVDQVPPSPSSTSAPAAPQDEPAPLTTAVKKAIQKHDLKQLVDAWQQWSTKNVATSEKRDKKIAQEDAKRREGTVKNLIAENGKEHRAKEEENKKIMAEGTSEKKEKQEANIKMVKARQQRHDKLREQREERREKREKKEHEDFLEREEMRKQELRIMREKLEVDEKSRAEGQQESATKASAREKVEVCR